MHVEDDDGTRSQVIWEQKASHFQNVHLDVIGAVSLKVVECGKYFGLKYLHAKQVCPSLESAAQLACPMLPEVLSHQWYPNVLFPQDKIKSGFSLVTNRSRIVLDLTGIPEDNRWVHHDYACMLIVKVVRQFKWEKVM